MTKRYGAILAGALAIAFVGAAVPAQAATDQPPPTSVSTPVTEATTTPAPSPTPTVSPTSSPAPTSSSSPAPAPGTSGSTENPSLSEMNAAGNHTMGSTIAAAEGTTRFRTLAAAPGISVDGILGQDVSGWQENVNWAAQWAAGSRFAYVKASEGTYYTSSWFAGQYSGSYNVGMIRGAYHFAVPNKTDGATQARFFYQHGGGWAPDGRTLPPLLDIEYGTDGTGACWGLDQPTMAQWIADFVTTLRALTGVNPAIYSTANWWNTCTGGNTTFGAYPLFVARYGTSTPGAIPAGWSTWSIWQFADSGAFAGDQDVFNGSQEQLRQFALGSPGPTAIAQKYSAMGGASGVLGGVASPVMWIAENGGGFAQAYANGSIYWSLSTGAHAVLAGALRDFYFASNGAAGSYGWPSSDTETVNANGGGYQQAFSAGAIYSSPAGTYLVSGSTRLGYFAHDGAIGDLGFPVAVRDCGLASGGCVQKFQYGIVYSDKVGFWYAVQGAVYNAFAAAGGVTGSWGYPTSNPIPLSVTSGSGVGQVFTGGSSYMRTGMSPFYVSGAVRDFYFSKGGAAGSLGWPAGTQSCSSNGSSCTQLFTGGTVAWTSANGGTVTAPQIDAAYAAAGGATGPLGTSRSDLIWVAQNGGGLGKAYANGSIYWTTAAGAYPVSGGIRNTYFGVSGSAGQLGWPTSGPVCTFSGSGCSQPFQNGSIIAGRTSTGFYTVTGAYTTALVAAGGTTGTLGLPTSTVLAIASNGGGSGQVFDGGSIFSSAAGTYAVSGGIRTFYFSKGGAAGTVGWPAGQMACSNGTCTQKFTGGTISWSSATGGVLTP